MDTIADIRGDLSYLIHCLMQRYVKNEIKYKPMAEAIPQPMCKAQRKHSRILNSNCESVIVFSVTHL